VRILLIVVGQSKNASTTSIRESRDEVDLEEGNGSTNPSAGIEEKGANPMNMCAETKSGVEARCLSVHQRCVEVTLRLWSKIVQLGFMIPLQ
jgi:hypothetical protein